MECVDIILEFCFNSLAVKVSVFHNSPHDLMGYVTIRLQIKYGGFKMLFIENSFSSSLES